MDLDQDKKTQITMDLLHELLSEMKMGAGSKLKPKEVVIEKTEISPDESEDKDGLQEHLDKVSEEEIPEELLEGLTDEEDEPEEEDISPASSRLNKRMGK